jgi:hypothetical protein
MVLQPLLIISPVENFHLSHLQPFISFHFCLVPLLALVSNHHHLSKPYYLRHLECTEEILVQAQGSGFSSLDFLDELMEKMASPRFH